MYGSRLEIFLGKVFYHRIFGKKRNVSEAFQHRLLLNEDVAYHAGHYHSKRLKRLFNSHYIKILNWLEDDDIINRSKSYRVSDFSKIITLTNSYINQKFKRKKYQRLEEPLTRFEKSHLGVTLPHNRCMKEISKLYNSGQISDEQRRHLYITVQAVRSGYFHESFHNGTGRSTTLFSNVSKKLRPFFQDKNGNEIKGIVDGRSTQAAMLCDWIKETQKNSKKYTKFFDDVKSNLLYDIIGECYVQHNPINIDLYEQTNVTIREIGKEEFYHALYTNPYASKEKYPIKKLLHDVYDLGFIDTYKKSLKSNGNSKFAMMIMNREQAIFRPAYDELIRKYPNVNFVNLHDGFLFFEHKYCKIIMDILKKHIVKNNSCLELHIDSYVVYDVKNDEICSDCSLFEYSINFNIKYTYFQRGQGQGRYMFPCISLPSFNFPVLPKSQSP